jgi:hypothetical protein
VVGVSVGTSASGLRVHPTDSGVQPKKSATSAATDRRAERIARWYRGTPRRSSKSAVDPADPVEKSAVDPADPVEKSAVDPADPVENRRARAAGAFAGARASVAA